MVDDIGAQADHAADQSMAPERAGFETDRCGEDPEFKQDQYITQIAAHQKQPAGGIIISDIQKFFNDRVSDARGQEP